MATARMRHSLNADYFSVKHVLRDARLCRRTKTARAFAQFSGKSTAERNSNIILGRKRSAGSFDAQITYVFDFKRPVA